MYWFRIMPFAGNTPAINTIQTLVGDLYLFLVLVITGGF